LYGCRVSPETWGESYVRVTIAANGDFGRELRMTYRKVVFSATADVQMKPLARPIP
jgi:hypothetical protein